MPCHGRYSWCTARYCRRTSSQVHGDILKIFVGLLVNIIVVLIRESDSSPCQLFIMGSLACCVEPENRVWSKNVTHIGGMAQDLENMARGGEGNK
jgi:hypothetical protein